MPTKQTVTSVTFTQEIDSTSLMPGETIHILIASTDRWRLDELSRSAEVWVKSQEEVARMREASITRRYQPDGREEVAG